MQAALVVSWTRPIPGREQEAIAYAREVDEYWGKFAAEGRCSEPEWFWASRGHSLWIVHGELEELSAIQARAESQKIMNKGALLVQEFEYDFHMYGREVGLKPFEDTARQLHLVA